MSPEREKALRRLEARLGVVFNALSLLDEALTHASYANERRGHLHNERLEFLGDAVVGAIVCHLLYAAYPSAPEGELARAKANLVSAGVMAEIGRELGLEELILLGRGERKSTGRGRDTIIADAVEAVVGAVYLDQTWEVTHALVSRLWAPKVAAAFAGGEVIDPKSALQELLQARGGGTPEYRLKAAVGPDHAKTFFAEVLYEGAVLAVGSGRSKKEAEQEAARAALRRMS